MDTGSGGHSIKPEVTVGKSQEGTQGHSREYEYKIEAVRLTTEGGISVTQAARDLGLNKNTLHNWRRHSSLDYLSPAEHEEPALAAQESVRNSGAVQPASI
jgi:transposase-like protein